MAGAGAASPRPDRRQPTRTLAAPTIDTPLPYLVALTIRLAEGLGRLPAPWRDAHAKRFLAALRPDGGFAGRDTVSDLYYTGFAVRSLALLDALDGPLAERIAGYLRGRFGEQAHVVDLFSLVFASQLVQSATGVDAMAEQPSDWRDRVAELIESLRRDDGGYAKSPEGAASSTYYSFLSVLTLELLERPIPSPDSLAEFILSQRREDGGFVEIRPMRRGGVNPTAAAVGVLRVVAPAAVETVADDVVDFLCDQQTDEGGFRANTKIPIADLLSTFTGLLTLADLDAAQEVDLAAVQRFARSVEQPGGGFLAAAWDEVVDVEYSFYGVATLGLLESLRDRG
ncbi:MAG: prenyltransferase/squalene oxidase repeat-containing protein [Planctomycetota bacterium]